MLPARQLPTGEFKFSDGAVLSIRGLSRAEALQLRSMGDDITAVEILCIKAATGETEDSVRAWHNTTPNDEIENLVNEIARLSGLDPDQGKEDAEGLHSAKWTELTTYLQKISDALSLKSESSQAPK